MILPKLIKLLNSEELVALLNSRNCHDLISPISAINNVIELSEELGFDDDLQKLLKDSAIAASNKLQFARIAYGFYGNTNTAIDLAELQKVANNFIVDNKINLIWQIFENNLSKLKAKLLLNILLIAKDCVPHKGNIIIKDENSTLLVIIEASEVKMPQTLIDIADNKLKKEQINAYNIQSYYSLVLAKEANTIIDISKNEQDLIIKF